jgi:DNA-binding NtrC family response regulator
MARILLVDDDEEFLSLISEYLGAYGFQSELAGNVAQARDWLQSAQFDAVLSDFSMPGESGLDLLSHVSSSYPGMPFILMSGSAGLKTRAMELGSMEFIPKPFEFKKMVSVLEKALG